MGTLGGHGGLREPAVGIRRRRHGLAVGRNRCCPRRRRLAVKVSVGLPVRQGLDIGGKPLVGLLLMMRQMLRGSIHIRLRNPGSLLRASSSTPSSTTVFRPA
jgi:hypothetical protein